MEVSHDVQGCIGIPGGLMKVANWKKSGDSTHVGQRQTIPLFPPRMQEQVIIKIDSDDWKCEIRSRRRIQQQQ